MASTSPNNTHGNASKSPVSPAFIFGGTSTPTSPTSSSSCMSSFVDSTSPSSPAFDVRENPISRKDKRLLLKGNKKFNRPQASSTQNKSRSVGKHDKGGKDKKREKDDVLTCSECTYRNSPGTSNCKKCDFPHHGPLSSSITRQGSFKAIEIGDFVVFLRRSASGPLRLTTGFASLTSSTGITVTSADATFGSARFWSDFILYEGMSATQMKHFQQLAKGTPTSATGLGLLSVFAPLPSSPSSVNSHSSARTDSLQKTPTQARTKTCQTTPDTNKKTWLITPKPKSPLQADGSFDQFKLAVGTAVSRVQAVARGGFSRKRVWFHHLGLRGLVAGDPVLIGVELESIGALSESVSTSGAPTATAAIERGEEKAHPPSPPPGRSGGRGGGDAEVQKELPLVRSQETRGGKWRVGILGGTVSSVDMRHLRILVSVAASTTEGGTAVGIEKKQQQQQQQQPSLSAMRVAAVGSSHDAGGSGAGGGDFKCAVGNQAANSDTGRSGSAAASATTADTAAVPSPSSPSSSQLRAVSVLCVAVFSSALASEAFSGQDASKSGAFVFQPASPSPSPSPAASSLSASFKAAASTKDEEEEEEKADRGGGGSEGKEVWSGFSVEGESDPSFAAGPHRWLLLPKHVAPMFQRAATKVQALARRMLTEFSELPLRRQEARRCWMASRAQHLLGMKRARRTKLTNAVTRQLSALPRPPLKGKVTGGLLAAAGEAAGEAAGGGSGVASSLLPPVPDKQHLVELQERLDSTVGLIPVKEWIEKTVEDALRFCMAGERLPLRHILLSGRLGSGRRTAAGLIAKTLRSLGLLSSDQLCESWGKFRSGCVMFVDHLGEQPSKVEDEVKEVGKGLANLEALDQDSVPTLPSLGPAAASNLTSSACVVILASRDPKALATLAGRCGSLQKREPLKLTLPPFTSRELAEVTLQRVAGKLSVESGVSLELVQLAIENRWSLGERQQRNVYIAFDMAEYLLHSAVLKETQQGRGNEILVSSRKESEGKAAGGQANGGAASPQLAKAIPVEVEALMETSTILCGASTIGVESLGLNPSQLLKETAKMSLGTGGCGGGGSGGARGDEGSSSVFSSSCSKSAPPSAQTSSPPAVSRAQAASIKAMEAATHLATKKERAARRHVDDEVEALVGMAGVKKWFEEMRGKVRYAESSKGLGQINSEILTSACLNMVLTGNPGTGKTTVARLMFRFLRAYGVLKRDVFVECNALELKGEYVGHTAPKVIATIRSALGGCLFLDEAYALSGDGSSGGKADVFSNEAVRTLLTEVENHRTSVMVILAGYRDKMSTLMRADPGMPRRFPLRHHLPDYSPQELTRIAQTRALQTYGMTFAPGVGFDDDDDDGNSNGNSNGNSRNGNSNGSSQGGKLAEGFGSVLSHEVSQHNGGLAVRVVDEAVGRFATRADRTQKQAQSQAQQAATSKKATQARRQRSMKGQGGKGGKAADHLEKGATTGDGGDDGALVAAGKGNVAGLDDKDDDDDDDDDWTAGEESDDGDDGECGGGGTEVARVLTIRDFDLEDHFDGVKRDAAASQAEADGKITAVEKAEAEERKQDVAAREALCESAMAELKGLVGLAGAKAHARKLVTKMLFVARGGSRKVLGTCLNLVLTGNPGTGKTTYARILHKVLFSHGVLKEDIFLEKNALQLKGQYVGQTSPLVSDAFAAARGGTLFLDEAPALVGANGDGLSGRGGGSSRDAFARDAVATLLTEVENHRASVMVVLAGYAGPMKVLLAADPGLRRRFPLHLDLPDYEPLELALIADKAAREQFGLTLGPGVQAALAQSFSISLRGGGSGGASSSQYGKYAAEVPHSNASLPLRLVEEALSSMAERVVMEDENSGESLTATAYLPPGEVKGVISRDFTTLLLADFGFSSNDDDHRDLD